jgi:hypothetical protein
MRSRALSTLLASLPLVVAAAAGTGAVDATAAGPPTTIAVPGDQPTIQAAIAAASPGDTIAIAPGVYDETLVIDKSLSLVGSGASATFLYHEVAAPLISITSSTVEIRDLELNGGTPWIGGDPGWFFGSSARGIVSEDSDLVLADLVINQFSNFAVTVNGGSIDVADVALQAQDRYRHQCDVGFQLNSCVASFDRLASESGWIDHTINVNDPPAGYSQVTLTNSTITSSELSWGDGIRAYSDVTLHVADNTFNRQPGGAPATAPNHTGVSINGFDVDATIAGNLFSGVPYGVVVHGSLPDSNSVKIENCTFENVEKTGVLVHSLDYDGVDLGGGRLGSAGNNGFTSSGSYDVELFASTADVLAIGNSWSDPDPDSVIWDVLDDPALGQVISSSIPVPALPGEAALLIAAGIGALAYLTANRKMVRRPSIRRGTPS